MQRFMYVVSTVLIIVGVILLCFSHEGIRYHVHETLVGFGPFQLLGSDGDATASFSPLYGSVCLGIGVILMLAAAFIGKRR